MCLFVVKQDKSLSKALSGSSSLMWCVGVSVWETQKYMLCVCVHVYIYVCVCMYMHVYIHVCVYVCVYV